MMIKKSKGFTLIEVLVASAIIITVSTIIVGIIVNTFRTSNKTSSVAIIRQNGTNAVEQISRSIKFADSYGGGGSGGYFNAAECNSTPTVYNEIRVVENGANIDISCTNSGIIVNGRPLINTSEVRVVEGSCALTCRKDNNVLSPVIGINFSLKLADSAKGALPEGAQAVNFSTSVKMRNF